MGIKTADFGIRYDGLRLMIFLSCSRIEIATHQGLTGVASVSTGLRPGPGAWRPDGRNTRFCPLRLMLAHCPILCKR